MSGDGIRMGSYRATIACKVSDAEAEAYGGLVDMPTAFPGETIALRDIFDLYCYKFVRFPYSGNQGYLILE